MRITRIATLAWLGVIAFTLPAQATQVCGNGVIETPEACDDGNTVGGDGCDNACGIAPDNSTLAIAGGTIAEGASGSTTPLVATVTRTGSTPHGINFGVRTISGTAGGSDYDGFADGRRYYLPADAASADVEVDVLGDFLAERDETFKVELYDAYRTGVITMEDHLPAKAVGDGPWGVAIADLDADGIADVVTSNLQVDAIAVVKNVSTTGAVTLGTVTPLDGGDSPYALAVGDLDGDGNPDILAGNLSAGTLSVLRHVTAPGVADFEDKAVLATDAGLHDLVIADLDGDGRPDVAGANLSADSVVVWRNTSDPGAVTLESEGSFPAGDAARSIAAADFDGDGLLDLAVTAFNEDKVAVLRNTSTAGAISFATAVTFTVGDGPAGLAVADFDGDGKADIAASNASAGTVSVLRNTIDLPGGLGFATHQTYTIDSTSYFLAAGDIDGGLKPDLVASSYSANRASVLRNTSSVGTLGFATREFVATGSGPYDVAIADIDRDGQADIVTANNTTDSVSVVRNRRPRVTLTAWEATATITNDDEVLFAFAQEESAADESDGAITVAVTMLGFDDEARSVTYTLGGTATQGADYTINPATLTFEPGETSRLITISGLADTAADSGATETIVITLVDPANGGLNPPNPHTVTVTNDSLPPVVTPPEEPGEGGGGGGGTMSLGLLLLALVRRRSR